MRSRRKNRSHKRTAGWLRTVFRRRNRSQYQGLGRSPMVTRARPHKARGKVRVPGWTGGTPLERSGLWWSSRPVWIHLGRPGAKRWTSCCRSSGTRWTWGTCGAFHTSATKTEGVSWHSISEGNIKTDGLIFKMKCCVVHCLQTKDWVKQILCPNDRKISFFETRSTMHCLLLKNK